MGGYQFLVINDLKFLPLVGPDDDDDDALRHHHAPHDVHVHDLHRGPQLRLQKYFLLYSV